jgi:hypothetical protein
MEDSQLEGNTQSFILRIWSEAVDDDDYVTALRGSIDHVGTGKRLYFQDLNEIARFVRDYIRLRPEPGVSK